MSEQGKPPFRKGDVLCLEGPNVADGIHIHRAGDPEWKDCGNGVLPVHGWCNGWRQWGRDFKGNTLRHATRKDCLKKIRLESDRVAKAASILGALYGMLDQLEVPIDG